jgi:NAD(P) transhydrogenase subunit beta
VNVLSSTATEVGYLVAAVCFILALKGLSQPQRPARQPDRRRGRGDRAASSRSCPSTRHHWRRSVAIAVGVGDRRSRRAPRADDPDAAAGALFNGVGGGRRGAGRESSSWR